MVNLSQAQSCSGLAPQLPTSDMHKDADRIFKLHQIHSNSYYSSKLIIFNCLYSNCTRIDIKNEYTFTSAAPLLCIAPTYQVEHLNCQCFHSHWVHTFPHDAQHVHATSYADRRKFRSQTSDNMQRWKSRGGKSQRGEVKK